MVIAVRDGIVQVRHSQILENGRVETKRLAKHRGRAHKLAIEPGSSRTFFSCAEDGVVRHVSNLLTMHPLAQMHYSYSSSRNVL